MLPTRDEFENWINEAFIKKGLMDKSYSHKPHLAKLPYDLTSNNPKELDERLTAIQDNIDDNEKLLESLKSTKDNLSNDLDTVEKDLGTYDKFMKNSQKELSDTVNNAVNALEDNYSNIFTDDDLTSREIIATWENDGLIKYYKQIDSLHYELNWDLGEIYENLPGFYKNLKGVTNSQANGVIKNLKELNKCLKEVYNNQGENLIKKSDSNIDSIIKEVSEFRNGLTSYRQTKKSNDKLVKDKENLEKDISNVDKQIKETTSLLKDYKEELKRTKNHINNL